MRAGVADAVQSLCKRRGFAVTGSEIYGGLAGCVDYGPLGTALKRNVAGRWWRDVAVRRGDVVGVDAAVLMPAAVWRATGHADAFADAAVECATCGRRLRADRLVAEMGGPATADVAALGAYLRAHPHRCADRPPGAVARDGDGAPCALGEVRQFNLMFRTAVGAAAGAAAEAFLRPETAQGIFVNFPLVAQTTRRRLPFGVAQVGRSFRNELSTGPFLFRLREFEQMELEYFCEPAAAPAALEHWVRWCLDWLAALGLAPDRLRARRHAADERAHYSLDTVDIEYAYPHGWGELWGVSLRGAFDLERHSRASGADLRYRDPHGDRAPFFPHVVEPAVGLDRLLYALLCDAYAEEPVDGGDPRAVLHLAPAIAPYAAAVLPLMRKPELVAAARNVHASLLRAALAVDYDDVGSIGKRYRRQDEVGTPLVVTVDYDTLRDGSVTLRDRDSMAQRRVGASDVVAAVRTVTAEPE
jgi:glycyl-tRNA synthetase